MGDALKVHFAESLTYLVKWSHSAYKNLKCAVSAFVEDNAASEGAALSFYSAFSLAPLLLILVAILGWLLGTEQADKYVHEQLRQLVGNASGDAIFEAAIKSRLAQSDQKAVASMIGVIAVMIGATTVFAEIQNALDRMWRAGSHARRGIMGWILTRIWSMGLVLTIGFLLLISLAVSTWLAALRNFWTPMLGDFTALTIGIDFVMAMTLNSFLFALIYRYLPVIRLPWKIVLQGGLMTAVLFYIGRFGISMYLARAATTSFYGAAASFAVLLLWLYYSAQIFLFGAQLTACIGGRNKSNDSQANESTPHPAAPSER